MSTYLVTQATGQQSQQVIAQLLIAGHKVHAIVRNPENLPPILKYPGVTVFKGESVQLDAVFQAAQGCVGVFLNTFPISGLESRQARTIIEASTKAGIESIVAATTFYTNEKSMWDDDVTKDIGLWDYFSSKAEVEDAVRGGGFKAYTILRPAFIHFDYLSPSVHGNYPDLPITADLKHSFTDEARMIHTSAYDIGTYTVAAFQDPVKFGGQEIELGNENLTVLEARDIVARVSGREVRATKRTPAEVEEARAKVFFQRFQFWANVKDFSATAERAAEVQAMFGIPFTPLEKSLEREKDRLLDCIPA